MTSGSLQHSLQSPVVLLLLGLVAVGVTWVLWRELRKVPPKLAVLMATAFVDMVGLLMILPLLPFYARRLGAGGFVVGLMVSSFAIAQLLSAPLWGRFSDRYGRRPALLVALGASAIAYVIFGYADSLLLLFISRLVQGAGGGTVGVIQAYVADATEPENRARSLGWLSAATNLGVALGPVLGAIAVTIGEKPLPFGSRTVVMGHAAPGLLAAAICVVNMLFAWRYLKEARQPSEADQKKPRTSAQAVWRVFEHSGEPASRLIWIYAIGIGAFQGTTAILALFLADRFGVNEKTISYFFTFIGAMSVFARVLLLGRLVDALGEAKLSRVGTGLLALGLATMPLAGNLPMLALSVALLPLGTAFTFPCVTALLSRVVSSNERGLYMGVQQAFGGTARVIFPVVYGFVFDHVGKSFPFWIAATLVAATILLGLGLDKIPGQQRRAAVAA